MRIRRSVRSRTTLAAITVLLPVLSVAAVTGVMFQRDDLTSGVTSLADEQARSIVRDLDNGREPAALGSEEIVVQVISAADSEVIAASPGAGGGPLLRPPTGTTPVRRTITGVLPGEPDR